MSRRNINDQAAYAPLHAVDQLLHHKLDMPVHLKRRLRVQLTEAAVYEPAQIMAQDMPVLCI